MWVRVEDGDELRLSIEECEGARAVEVYKERGELVVAHDIDKFEFFQICEAWDGGELRPNVAGEADGAERVDVGLYSSTDGRRFPLIEDRVPHIHC